MNTQPLVAICVPVYNAEQHLERALDSLVNQTYRNIVIICADDASTDGSVDILDYYAENDTRIKVITHTHNKGAGGGYNTCIDYALDNTNAEYICQMDNDDYSEPDMVEVFVETAVRSGADIVVADCFFCSEGSEHIKQYNKVSDCLYNTLLPIETNWNVIFDWVALWNKCIRADYIRNARAESYTKSRTADGVIRHCGVRFTEVIGECYPDTGFMLRLCVHGGTAYYIKKAFVHYVIRANSITRKAKSIAAYFDEVDATSDYYAKTGFNGTAFVKTWVNSLVKDLEFLPQAYLDGKVEETVYNRIIAWQNNQRALGNL
ncbi:MAG: glycosyltransferase [Oscillospiraceae bacterium]|jgi:glycosyltransferase involved in cell wall biosynthesis|nr:glycosyltransferase [Oscillospiraceae bacterium]